MLKENICEYLEFVSLTVSSSDLLEKVTKSTSAFWSFQDTINQFLFLLTVNYSKMLTEALLH